MLAIGAIYAGKAAGFGLFECAPGNQIAHLYSVYVHAQLRGQGLGKALVSYASSLLRQQSYHTIAAEFVADNGINPVQAAFWKHAAFSRFSPAFIFAEALSLHRPIRSGFI
ncbi:GNAT family N-acetyltransferase [Paenibacillus hexagrammi]|uniref:GNAT family N-acetyltransferase n=1 Tax=Paenibacillus hexagrammi TaxID=2908839 RepID=A0ABY3SPB7_9BACL|nr:GNAT family N-acetyltransferase [Paenibacillus sp. YPD9-1]UJF34827.1 GNAT family N-acetyltransferase [Paenibacillus sp. YPD9-1]